MWKPGAGGQNVTGRELGVTRIPQRGPADAEGGAANRYLLALDGVVRGCAFFTYLSNQLSVSATV